jgi:hypothetical protein
MSSPSYMLEWFSDTSRRLAVFEDDGASAWLYLTATDTRKPIADVWVHNRRSAIPRSKINAYRGDPPPAAIGFADDSAICHASNDCKWTLDWYLNDEFVILYRDGTPVAMLAVCERRGWSRNLLQDGPWGNVWSDELYRERTQADG